MSLRMSEETFRTFKYVKWVLKWTILYWMFMLTLLVPACRETLPETAQMGFNQIETWIAQ